MKICSLAITAALLCLALSACGGTPSAPAPAESSPSAPTGGMTLVNPMQAVSSLDEINSAIGCHVKAPADIAVSEEAFFVISGTVGEYRFSVDGIHYTLRASATADDISGVYVDGKTLGEAAGAAGDGSADTAVFDGGMWTHWFEGDMQYSLLSDETGTADTAGLFRVRDALR